MKTVHFEIAPVRHGDWKNVEIDGDGRRMGSAQIEPNCFRKGHPNHHAWVWSVWVDEELRGKKVGELLMIHTVLEAYRLGHNDVRLHVYSDNKAARRCYEKIGFDYLTRTPSIRGDLIPPDWPYPYENETNVTSHYKEHRKWMEACTYAEVCPVPWYDDVHTWTMTMKIELTPEKIAELRKRRTELRRHVKSVDWKVVA